MPKHSNYIADVISLSVRMAKDSVKDNLEQHVSPLETYPPSRRLNLDTMFPDSPYGRQTRDLVRFINEQKRR